LAKGLNTSAVALGASGALIGLGSFLPWMTVLSLSRSGLDGGGDGILTLAIGIILVLVAVASFAGTDLGGSGRILGLFGGLGAVAIAILDGNDVANRITSVSSEYVSGSIGMGLYVVGIGGVLAVLVALFGGRRKRAAPA
jgi:hypothetical protein